MPLLHLITNAALELELKKAICQELTEQFSLIQKAGSKVHIVIQGSSFRSLASDEDSPAVYVSVKAAARSIDHNTRTALVKGFGAVLAARLPALREEGVYLVFEEVPCENIAVGSSIMRFNTMHTVPSV